MAKTIPAVRPITGTCTMKSLRYLGLLLFTLISTTDLFADDAKTFRAGAFAQDITPKKFPISVNGNMRDTLATKVHDPLHARCLVLDDGRTKLAIAVCDSCMIPREIIDAAKQRATKATGIPENHILISATHTHEAPTVGGVFQSDPDLDYVQQLTEQIAEGITKAHALRQPAKIGWGVGKNSEQVFNRRWFRDADKIPADPFDGKTDQVQMNPGYQSPGLIKPAGPIDPDVTVIAVQSLGGKPLAVLANYSLHYVGGVEPLSADYFGAFAERITQLVGAEKVDPAFVGIMSNGTSGDCNNINFGKEPPPKSQPYERIKLVADSVAQTAFAAYQSIKYHDWVPLAMAEREIELGVRRPSEAEVARAKEIVAQAKQPILQGLKEVYARETILMANYPPTVKARLQAIRIGELAILSSPCETFAEIGLDLKRRSPFPTTCTIELANGYNGYLPTPDQHKLGGYETWRARSSYVEVDSSPKIVKTLLELLGEVRKK
jgi:hypothetical protein